MESLINDVTKINIEKEKLTELTTTLEAVDIKLKSQETKLKELNERFIDTITSNNKLERKNINLKNDNDFLNYKLNDFKYNTMKAISKQIHEDLSNKKQYEKMVNNLKK